MNQETKCPKCSSEDCYFDGNIWICPICAHEWNVSSGEDLSSSSPKAGGICDAHGQELKDGDSVTVIKDLKIKGSSSVVKVGTKVKSIRLIEDAVDGHNLSCRIDGIGSINLKSEFVKKS